MRKARGVSRRRKKRISGLNELTKEQTSAIGDIIDMPIEDFKQSLIDQQVNVGIMMNLTHLLSAVYVDLQARKDTFVNMVVNKQKTREEVQSPLDGIYAEMIKVEEKLVHLKERIHELSDVGRFDTVSDKCYNDFAEKHKNKNGGIHYEQGKSYRRNQCDN